MQPMQPNATNATKCNQMQPFWLKCLAQVSCSFNLIAQYSNGIRGPPSMGYHIESVGIGPLSQFCVFLIMAVDLRLQILMLEHICYGDSNLSLLP